MLVLPCEERREDRLGGGSKVPKRREKLGNCAVAGECTDLCGIDKTNSIPDFDHN